MKSSQQLVYVALAILTVAVALVMSGLAKITYVYMLDGSWLVIILAAFVVLYLFGSFVGYRKQ